MTIAITILAALVLAPSLGFLAVLFALAFYSAIPALRDQSHYDNIGGER